MWAWRGPGSGLVRAWRGPGAGLAILGWAQDCCLNPALATGLPQPFLRHTQNALMHYQQLWLGAVLARAQPCDPCCRAPRPQARRLCSGQRAGRLRRCCGLGRCREDRHIWPVGVPGGAEREDRPARPGVARSRCAVAAAYAARCSAPAGAAV